MYRLFWFQLLGSTALGWIFWRLWQLVIFDSFLWSPLLKQDLPACVSLRQGLLSGVRTHPLGDKGAGLPVCSAGYWRWSNNGRLSCMTPESPRGEGEGPKETHQNTPINRCMPCLWKAGEEGWLFSFITWWHALIVSNPHTIIMRFIELLFVFGFLYLWYPTIIHGNHF